MLCDFQFFFCYINSWDLPYLFFFFEGRICSTLRQKYLTSLLGPGPATAVLQPRFSICCWAKQSLDDGTISKAAGTARLKQNRIEASPVRRRRLPPVPLPGAGAHLRRPLPDSPQIQAMERAVAKDSALPALAPPSRTAPRRSAAPFATSASPPLAAAAGGPPARPPSSRIQTLTKGSDRWGEEGGGVYNDGRRRCVVVARL
ncbi:hypothetical protein PAHAL_4G018300 [Panicum hallii]|jgi:hypothetical protein|uniref:Uncharacterized protein n=1 Tax=Panicum hallii TaxID=206008 RepID=A0A2T8JBF3_9POAL|nr:hypothetical protein PAHAL_4G018300 [Panicum hallii]